MNILIGGIVHETNTFSNVKTNQASFQHSGWEVGEDVFINRGVRNYVGGMIDRAESLGIGIIPTFATSASPSGVITKETERTLIETLVSHIHAAKGYDAVLLSLHGAGVSETTEDFEGTILEEVRSVIGPDMPLIVTLDLHANMTEKMIEL